MPPYVCTTEDIAAITSALVGSVAEVHGSTPRASAVPGATGKLSGAGPG